MRRLFFKGLIFIGLTLVFTNGVFARPTKEEKKASRASYWGLFADIYRVSACLSHSPIDNSCLRSALTDSQNHALHVDQLLESSTTKYKDDLSLIARSIESREYSLARDDVLKVTTRLISEFSSSLAPTVRPDLSSGMTLFNNHCSGCHGNQIAGEGRLAHKLRRIPVSLTSHERKKYQTPFGIYAVMIHGVENSEMASYLDILSVDELWTIAFYMSALTTSEIQGFQPSNFEGWLNEHANQFSLATLAVTSDDKLLSYLKDVGLDCGTCDGEIGFLRRQWIASESARRLGDVDKTPRQASESKAIAGLFAAIIAVFLGFLVLLRRRSGVE